MDAQRPFTGRNSRWTPRSASNSSVRVGLHVTLAATALAAIVLVLTLARPQLHSVFLHANEAQAVADLLEFSAAADELAGLVGIPTPERLADPRRSSEPGRTNLHRRFLLPVRNGYRFEFRGSADVFTYRAAPVIPGRTGRRSFLYDSQTHRVREFGASESLPNGHIP